MVIPRIYHFYQEVAYSIYQYLLKVSLVYKTFFQSLAFLLYIINLFFAVYKRHCLLTCLQHQPTGVGQHGKGAPMVDDLKKRRPEHCFPVISNLFIPPQQLAVCCQFTQILVPVGMHPRNHRKTFLLPSWFNTSLSSVKDRLEQLMREL